MLSIGSKLVGWFTKYISSVLLILQMSHQRDYYLAKLQEVQKYTTHLEDIVKMKEQEIAEIQCAKIQDFEKVITSTWRLLMVCT